MRNATYLLVEQDVLPEVFTKVLQAKEFLVSGEASSTSEAVRMAGISRSALYKYKDFVHNYIFLLDNLMVLLRVTCYTPSRHRGHPAEVNKTIYFYSHTNP